MGGSAWSGGDVSMGGRPCVRQDKTGMPGIRRCTAVVQSSLASVVIGESAAKLEWNSVAERSFSLYDGVQMFVKPMSQPLLYGSRQLQDPMHKTQGLKDFKMASRIRNDITGCKF